jgi:hypothetical protein
VRGALTTILSYVHLLLLLTTTYYIILCRERGEEDVNREEGDLPFPCGFVLVLILIESDEKNRNGERITNRDRDGGNTITMELLHIHTIALA